MQVIGKPHCPGKVTQEFIR